MIEWLKSKLGGNSRVLPMYSAHRLPPLQQLPGVPFDIAIVSGKQALDALLALRTVSGRVPVAFGDRKQFARVTDEMSFASGSHDNIVQTGLRIDIGQWITQQIESDPEYYQAEESDITSARQSPPLSIARETFTGLPKADIVIGMIPVSEPWQVPAYLRPGGWNECPDAATHLAFYKHWFEKYGAIVTSICHDIMEFSVERPPSTMEEARQLAHEQFAYCPDTVHQGVESLENLARVLLNAENWFFWWD